MTRTLDPQELLEIRKMIWEEVNLQRTCGDDLLPLPPDEVFKYDSVATYVDEAHELVDTIKYVAGDNAAEIQYVLVVAAAAVLVELAEWLRDTGGVE